MVLRIFDCALCMIAVFVLLAHPQMRKINFFFFCFLVQEMLPSS